MEVAPLEEEAERVTSRGPGGGLSRAERHQLRQAGLSDTAVATLAALDPVAALADQAVGRVSLYNGERTPTPLQRLPLGRLQMLRWAVFRRRERKRRMRLTTRTVRSTLTFEA
ncbi:hypothetical protein ACHAPV_000324 [Trichoderma viride]